MTGDDERFRLRTLQARAYFEQAAAATDAPKLQGIYLTSATNMTRKLDTGLAIAEYKRLLAMASMAELTGTLREALAKAEEMQVAELREAKREERRCAAMPESDPRSWRMLPSFGPFALEPINFGALGFRRDGARYRLELEHALLEGLQGKGFASRGYATPAQELRMEPNDRRLRKIPLEATQFAWAFPLSGVAEAEARDGMIPKSREEAFALFGGFIYLNAN